MNRSRHRLTAAAAIAAASLWGLTACASPGGGEADPAPTSEQPAPPSSVPAEPSTSAPAPSAPPAGDDEDVADPATWEIDDAEVGPLEIGEDFQETLSELPADAWTNDENCAWTAFWNAQDADYSIWFARDAAADRGPVATITIEGSAAGAGPRTDDGRLGLGSTRDEVRAVYANAEEVDSAIEGRSFLRIADDDPEDGAMYFAYLEGQAGAQSVVLTTLQEPPYEVCA